VESLVSAVIKSRRQAGAAFADWKRSPSPELLAQFDQANRVRGFAEDQLRDALLGDEGLLNDVMRAAGG
jgi:hypothetical protein